MGNPITILATAAALASFAACASAPATHPATAPATQRTTPSTPANPAAALPATPSIPPSTIAPITAAPAITTMPATVQAAGAATTTTKHGSPLIEIPAGEYWTGCDTDGDDYCRPQDGAFRRVHLDTYYVDEFEVTVANYAACVQAGGCSAQGLQGYDDGEHVVNWMNCNWGKVGRDDHPLNCVSWKQADNYCRWAGKRLPTEAEWEKAARGTDQRTYPWGDEMISCEYAVTNQTGQDADKGCGNNATAPIGSKPKGASPYGVQDIVGNVWEWTADEYAPAAGEPAPKPGDDTHHVGKGGCWGSGNPWNSRISWSHHYPANYGSNVRLGFRCGADDA